MDKDKLIEKWGHIINPTGSTSSKTDWLAQYAQSQQEFESNTTLSDLGNGENNLQGSFLPIAMKVAAKTIGFDLVSVQPMEYDGLSEEERRRLEGEIKQENRDSKIDSIVEGKEYTEKTIKDHPDYKPGPKSHLMYLDYVYGGATSSK
jgi:hypothetical protein